MDLARAGLGEMTRASAQLRRLGEGAATMEEAARRAVRYLFDLFIDEKGERSCALVRLYKTHTWSALPEPLQQVAGGVSSSVKCLTLLASAGVEEAWNARQTSQGHRAIPLTSPEALEKLPMVSQLLVQLGVDVSRIAAADQRLMVDAQEKTFNVFHVEKAKGSPYIPAQERFVEPYRIASVLGFGGALPGGDLFSAILFSRAPIGRNTAELFRPLALSLKLTLLPFDGKVFEA
jgi:hypothetical protein